MRPGLSALILLAGLSSIADARAAQLIVVSDSAGIGFVRGSVIEDGATVKLAAGDRLALIDSNGKGITLRGPYDGPIHAAVGSGAGDGTVISAMQQLIAKSDRREIGVVRAAGPVPTPADPHVIDAQDEATQCAAPNGPAELWRPGPARHTMLFLSRLSTNERAQVDWPANRATVPWPDTIALVDKETYQAAFQGEMAKARIVIRVVPFAAPALDAAQRLADAGCGRQALTMLEAIADPATGH